MPHSFRLAPLLAAAILLIPGSAHSSWQTNGVPVSTLGEATIPGLIGDGAGGAIVAWKDGGHDPSGPLRLYAQRIDGFGRTLWVQDGLPVCTACAVTYSISDEYKAVEVTSDGAGGAIIAWKDSRTDAGDIYVQRLSPSGQRLWNFNGLAVCSATGAQDDVVLVADGAGGAIVSWSDPRSGDVPEIYAQRISASGTVLWNHNGVRLTTLGNQRHPVMVSDDAGGAIVAWFDDRGFEYEDIRVQRLSPSGNSLWLAEGEVVTSMIFDLEAYPRMTRDGQGGAILVWQDERGGQGSSIQAQQLDSEGNKRWTPSSLQVPPGVDDPIVALDGVGGGVVVARRLVAATGDIYAQRVDAAGQIQWGPSGLPVCVASGAERRPAAIADGLGGTVAVWNDARGFSLYAQRLDPGGVPLWGFDGVPLGVGSQQVGMPSITSNGAHGVFAAWENASNVYIQRVDQDGSVGLGAPPAGPWFRVRSLTESRSASHALWLDSNHDDLPVVQSSGHAYAGPAGLYARTSIRCEVTYNVASAREEIIAEQIVDDLIISPTVGSSLAPATGVSLPSLLTTTLRLDLCGHAVTDAQESNGSARSTAQMSVDVWFSRADNGEPLGFFNGSVESFRDAYQGDVDTMVICRGSYAGACNHCDRVSTPSVELPINTPIRLYMIFHSSSSVSLAADSLPSSFAIGRSYTHSESVLPGPSILSAEVPCGDSLCSLGGVHFPADAPVFDLPVGFTVNSQQASIQNNAYTANPNVGVPARADFRRVELHLAQPNPFSRATTLSYSLAAQGSVKLAVYDMSGRRVRVLAVGIDEAGDHRVEWNGMDHAGHRVRPGVYLARLVTNHGTVSRRIVHIE